MSKQRANARCRFPNSKKPYVRTKTSLAVCRALFDACHFDKKAGLCVDLNRVETAYRMAEKVLMSAENRA